MFVLLDFTEESLDVLDIDFWECLASNLHVLVHGQNYMVVLLKMFVAFQHFILLEDVFWLEIFQIIGAFTLLVGGVNFTNYRRCVFEPGVPDRRLADGDRVAVTLLLDNHLARLVVEIR